MDLRRQLGVLRSWFWLLVASVLLAGGSAYLVSNALPKVYEGRVTLIVGQSLQATSPDYNQLLASQRLSQTYADLATTTPVLQAVIKTVQLDVAPEDFRKRVRADAPRDSTLLTITAEDGDPARAARIANALAAELIAQSPAIAGRNTDVQQFVDSDLAAIQEQIAATQLEVQRLAGLPTPAATETEQLQALQARLVTLRQTYATLLGFSSSSGTNLLTVVDPASPAAQPASPRILLNTVLAALVGLLHRDRHRVPVRVPGRLAQVVRRGRRGHRPAHAGGHPAHEGRRARPQQDLPPGDDRLSAQPRRGGLPDPADQRRVRQRGRAGPFDPGHQLHPRRRQDHDRRQPRRRPGPGGQANRPARRGPSQARRAPAVRPGQRGRPDHPPAIRRRPVDPGRPGHRRREPARGDHRARCRPTRPSCWPRTGWPGSWRSSRPARTS